MLCSRKLAEVCVLCFKKTSCFSRELAEVLFLLGNLLFGYVSRKQLSSGKPAEVLF